MWKPPERIRHPLPEPAWPTAAAAAAARWFQPVEVGPVRLAERTWVPAMVPWRATEEGFVTPEVLAWYERFARGEPGAIVVEATGIRDVPSGPLLRAGDDRFLPGLSELVSAVRRASGGRTRLFLQIIDFLSIRRRPEREIFLSRFLQISDGLKEKLSVRGDVEARSALLTLADSELRAVLSEREWHDLQFGARELVTDLHLPSVRELPRVLPELFALAALRAERAGFDGVELHFAHAYTMASFLSPGNTRDDGYGGARENRVRLPLEVIAAVRARVGSGFAVGCRFLAEERIGVEGGEGRSRTPRSSPQSSRAPGSTSSRCRAVASSRMRSSRRSVGRPIRTPALRATSACRRRSRTLSGRSGAMWPRWPRSAPRCAAPACRRRWCSPAASRASRRRKRCSNRGRPTSSPQRASRSPIPTGSARSAWGVAPTSGAASSRTTAKGSTRCTSR